MEEAQRLCERVAIMDRGQIRALDTVEGLINRFGGQSVVEAELDGPPPDGVALPGKVDGSVLRFESDRPFEEAARLVAAGVRFATFRVDRPNLEVVFLALTGRRLRD